MTTSTPSPATPLHAAPSYSTMFPLPSPHTSNHLPPRLTLVPDRQRQHHPAMLESALKLVNSLNAKRNSRNRSGSGGAAMRRSRYEGSSLRPSDSVGRRGLGGFAGMEGVEHEDAGESPGWLSSALTTRPQNTVAERVHTVYARRAHERASLAQPGLRATAPHGNWTPSSPTMHAERYEQGDARIPFSGYLESQVQATTRPEPEFLSDLDPHAMQMHAAASPPRTPAAAQPYLDTYSLASGSQGHTPATSLGYSPSWALLAGEEEEEAAEEGAAGLDVTNFWKRQGRVRVPSPPRITPPERDAFAAQLRSQNAVQMLSSPVKDSSAEVLDHPQLQDLHQDEQAQYVDGVDDDLYPFGIRPGRIDGQQDGLVDGMATSDDPAMGNNYDDCLALDHSGLLPPASSPFASAMQAPPPPRLPRAAHAQRQDDVGDADRGERSAKDSDDTSIREFGIDDSFSSSILEDEDPFGVIDDDDDGGDFDADADADALFGEFLDVTAGLQPGFSSSPSH
ncbi:hypothetical protein V8E36_006992 [Tilletia maclaganii]